MSTITEKIVVWFATGETGTSSKHMAAVACGTVPTRNHPTPSDPSDLNRCIKLVQSVPDVRDAFPQIAQSSDRWAIVIRHWDELVALFHAEVGEDWSRGHSAPKTYKRMKEVGL